VKISIYDINGRLINTLVNAGYPAGRYLVKWNGADAAGIKVSSGTYFYTMEADSGNDCQEDDAGKVRRLDSENHSSRRHSGFCGMSFYYLFVHTAWYKNNAPEVHRL